jgi:hypothetical protein
MRKKVSSLDVSCDTILVFILCLYYHCGQSCALDRRRVFPPDLMGVRCSHTQECAVLCSVFSGVDSRLPEEHKQLKIHQDAVVRQDNVVVLHSWIC